MAVFKDTNGVTWNVRVTISTLQRVKSETGFNLLELAQPESKLLQECSTDPVTLFTVLCAVLRPELDNRKMTDVQLGDALDEETSSNAVLALMDALFDFFPDRKRALLKAAHGKVMDAHKRIIQTGTERAEAMLRSPTADADIESLLLKVLNGESGNTPGSSPATSAP